MQRTVLVTGGAGYIGSHTCKALAEAGFHPVALDNLVHGHKWSVKWGPLEHGDTRESDAILRIIDSYSPIAVIHFAAFAYVGESVSNPQKYYDNNIVGTLGLLDAMLRSEIDKLIFSSTCATYGVPRGGAIQETQPQDPINPYGRSKLIVEQILRDFDSAYKLRSIALRYFNAAGADPDCEIGESHDPETHLIPLVLDAASGRRQNITVFGNDYDTPDGTCIRDYVHVQDLADAHVGALHYLLDGGASDAFNLGTGVGSSVREVIDAAKLATGRELAVIEGPRRPGDPPSLVAAPGRAREILGWEPKMSDIETIIETSWAWHRSYFGH
ncbi:MAG: UDP-glucose 4-epimerase GalE [Gammaproteobacteria bacterium]|nr:UDP-glucose 4-epimerase GalE [Gammaproteobacteria bacterium]MBU2676742.1 UDP-glucose 4-epimerase GalE [Gammaproteobacteria bacterium]NNC57834.1 UDP-glucose 4-epimerase GalE [Woeseiaceae bacterium]NNL50477.1 UDP-glucose 4-epimerase GalE [Woeseiaceae bacterium]